MFKGRSAVEICAKHLHSAPVVPSERLGRAVPADLEAIVLRCLAKSSGERYSSAAELERALAACAVPDEWSAERARAWWQMHGGTPTPAREVDGRGQTVEIDPGTRQAALRAALGLCLFCACQANAIGVLDEPDGPTQAETTGAAAAPATSELVVDDFDDLDDYPLGTAFGVWHTYTFNAGPQFVEFSVDVTGGADGGALRLDSEINDPVNGGPDYGLAGLDTNARGPKPTFASARVPAPACRLVRFGVDQWLTRQWRQHWRVLAPVAGGDDIGVNGLVDRIVARDADRHCSLKEAA